MLIAFALAAAAAHTVPLQTHLVARGVSCVGPACTADPRRSRYRLDPQDDTGVDLKQAALATDGSACSIVGARVCTRKPRTIFTTDFTD